MMDPLAIVYLPAIVIMAVTVIVQTRTIRRLRESLNTVRFATYEITQALGDEIKDLRTSLARADIPIAHEQMDERLRRMALTPQQRHDESLARFNEAVAESRRLWEDSSD